MNPLPLFPLNTVLFPGGRLNLRVFEKRYVDMIARCLKSDSPFGVCLIRQGREVGDAADPQAVGTLAHVAECDLERPGILRVVARGTGRFRVRATEVRQDQLLLAEVDELAERSGPMSERHRRLVDTLRRVLAKTGTETYFPPPRWDDSAWVGGRLAELFPLPLGLKQALLEMDDVAARLDMLAEFFPAAGGRQSP
jgi:Lon protease-like protein